MKLSAYKTIVQRYGRPDVDVFDEDSYRVILWDVHVHQGAAHGQLSGHGTSLAKACQNLLDTADKPSSLVVQTAHCNQQCFTNYSTSPAAALAAKEFWAFAKGVSNKKKVKKGK